MKIAAQYGLPAITSSDAHQPEDCGSYNDEAREYLRSFGYKEIIQFSHRKRTMISLEEG